MHTCDVTRHLDHVNTCLISQVTGIVNAFVNSDQVGTVPHIECGQYKVCKCFAYVCMVMKKGVHIAKVVVLRRGLCMYKHCLWKKTKLFTMSLF